MSFKKYFFIVVLLLGVVTSGRADGSSSQSTAPRSVKHGMGLRRDTATTEAFCKRYGMLTSVEPNTTARARYAAHPGQRVGLAEKVKNWQYLPKVGDQGNQGSCAAYSTCYYYKTFQEAKARGWERPDPIANPERIMSPAFIYNMANGGGDYGSWIETVMQLLLDHGCATQTEMPYNDADYTTWPSSSVWKHATAYRAHTATTIDLSTDAGITALKQHCANGDIAVTGIDVYTNFYNYPDDGRKTNNSVVYDDAGEYEGGHGITIIGYDDTRAYNDGTGTQYGAFLLMNSWATSWGVANDLNDNGIIETGYESGGMVWLSYPYMKKKLDDNTNKLAYLMTDKISYTPTTYAIVGLSHENRSMVTGIYFATSTAVGAATFTCFNWDQSMRFPLDSVNDTKQCGPGGNHAINQRIYIDVTAIDTMSVITAKLYEGENQYGRSNPNGTITYLAMEDASGTLIAESTQTPKSWTTYNTTCEFRIQTPFPKAHITLSAPSPVQGSTVTVSLSIEPASSVISTVTLTCVQPDSSIIAIPLSQQSSVWSGTLVIAATAALGTAQFLFRAVDSLGNVGTRILDGETFVIGAQGVPAKLRVYPNPCTMQQNTYVHIGNISNSAQNLHMYFYDVTGALVRTLDTDRDVTSNGTVRVAQWDGKNDSGNNVASGVYVCVVKGDGYSRTTKIAIIN